MCQLKSAIMLKDKVLLLPNEDSHTAILEHFNIPDTSLNPIFVRVELLPSKGDVFAPIDSWKFNVDQDVTPEGFIKEIERERMIVAVKEWAKEHIHIDKSNFSIKEGSHYLKDCKDVEAWGNATVEAWDNTTVKAQDNATVKARGNVTVEAWDNATVEAQGNATVEAWGNATVVIPSWSSNKRENITLLENSTLKDCNTKTIYQSGDWKLVAIE